MPAVPNQSTDIECDGCGAVVLQWKRLSDSDVNEIVELFGAIDHMQSKLHALVPGSARISGSYVLCEGCAP